MTLRLVPGGPEPMTKGLGSLRPSTVVANVGIILVFVFYFSLNLAAKAGRAGEAKRGWKSAGLAAAATGPDRGLIGIIVIRALCADGSYS